MCVPSCRVQVPQANLLRAVNLGVSARVKYGFLLDKFTDRLPVFRTESQEYVPPSCGNPC
jgi:hypothetical protein